MFSKLKEIYARYEKLSERLADPAVLSDMELWTKLSKDRAEIEEVSEAYRAYLKKEGEMNAALAEAEAETGEMRELLLDEAQSCKEKLAVLLGELKILLLPKDKNDERNCTLEIRAGAGGEEAALFAYKLYRMYMGYCEKHRLKWEVIDLNETELGGMKEAVIGIEGKGAFTASNAFPIRNRRAGSTRPPVRSPCFRRRRTWKWRSATRISASTCSVPPARAGRR